MTRRIVSVVAWLVTVSMNALWVRALVAGAFMDSMQTLLSSDEQQAAQTTIVWLRPAPGTTR